MVDGEVLRLWLPVARNSSRRAGRDRMRKAWLTVRSILLWTISGIHFAVVCIFLIVLAAFVDPRKNDWPQRLFFRNILRLAGVRFEVQRAPGFDPERTCIFICNHVNIFDPFVVYSAIPQFLRGFELESHFKIPVYGWMMGRFGNIAVPDAPSRESLEIMTRRAKAALDSGHQPDRLCGRLTHARWPRAALQEGNLQSGAEIRRADRAGEHRRIVRIFSDGQLDALSRENYGLSARYD